MQAPARESRHIRLRRVLAYRSPGRDDTRTRPSLMGHGGQTMKTKQQHTPGPRRYEALPNDENDKRTPGSWKVCMTWTDERGHHAQKFAQEIYREDHARQIAAAMNRESAAPDMLNACIQVRDTAHALAAMLPKKQAFLAEGVLGFADIVRAAIAKAEGR